MPVTSQSVFLLASPEPALLSAIEPVLLATGLRVEVVLSAQAALAAISAYPSLSLALLDEKLPGMETGPLLTGIRCACGTRLPIVLIADSVSPEWIDHMAAGTIDDVILRATEPAYWRLRISMALHTYRLGREIDALREASARDAQFDRLTSVYNRQAFLSMLFRETDRMQRQNSSLTLMLFDIDDFGHWNSRLGNDACDELLCQVAARTSRLLRSYDLIGRPGKDEFLLALPGCDTNHALALAERLRAEVFCEPFHVAGVSIRLSTCFGIAASNGRSPVVVLRETEQALTHAKEIGPDSILCFGEPPQSDAAPAAFLLNQSGDELMAW